MVLEILREYLGNEYLVFLSIISIFYLLSRGAYWIIDRIIRKLAKKTKTTLDDEILDSVERPISLILLFIGIRLGLTQLKLAPIVNKVFSGINNTIIVIIIGVIIARFINILLEKWSRKWTQGAKNNIDKNLVKFLDQIINIAIYTILLLFILDSVWGIQIGPLLASLGVAGIAVAFALQSTLGNVFGGISMIVDKNIAEGDIVELEDGKKGEVIDIGFRSTKMKTFNNETLVVPNGKLADSILQNYAKPDITARVVVPFSVAYGSSIEKVKKLIFKELGKVQGFIPEPAPKIRFLEMANSSLNFTAYFWIENYENRYDAIDEANTKIYNALNNAKVSIPFPQLDVHMKKK
jgi:small-conductance mechanosensitive channel